MPRKKYPNIRDYKVENMSKGYKDRVEEMHKDYTALVDRYGPKGKMFGKTRSHPAFPKKDEYDSIEIDAKGKLSDTMVTAIVMGSMLRPDRLSTHVLTSSSIGGTDILGMNNTLIMQNMVEGDDRIGEFEDLLPAARKDAKNVIDDLTGDDPVKAEQAKEKATQMVNDYIDAAIRSSEGLSFFENSVKDAIGHESRSVIMAGQLYGQPPLNCKGSGKYTEAQTIRMVNIGKQYDALVKSAECRDKLINDPPAPNSAERKKLVEDTLFNTFVARINNAEITASTGEIGAGIVSKVLDNLGTEGDLKNELGSSPAALNTLVDAGKTYQKYHISDLQVLLSKPDGEKKLRELYHKAIVNSDRYKDLVEADSKKDICTQLEDINDETLMKEYSGVKLPSAAKDINKKLAGQYDKDMAKLKNKFEQEIVNTDRLYKADSREYGIASLDKEDLAKNARIMAEMYKSLDDNDSWYKSSSNEFKAVKESMKKLKTLAENMAKKGEASEKDLAEYDRLSRETYANGERYLDYKQVADGDYAKGRVSAVSQLRRHLGTNLRSVREAYERREIAKDDKLQAQMNDELQVKDNIAAGENEAHKKASEVIAAEKLNSWENRSAEKNRYAIGNKETMKSFYGDKYTLDKVENTTIPGTYSLGRTAGYSLTLAILAREKKYTMEQLLDPDMLKEEKAKTFNTVVEKMKAGDDKWIAENMYEGHKALAGLMNEAEKKIDISDPDVLFKKDTMLFQNMIQVTHDIWQEQAHCEKELMELVHKDYPNIKDYEEFKDFSSKTCKGPLTSVLNDKEAQMERLVTIKNRPANQSMYGSPMVMQAVSSKVAELRFNQFKESRGNLPYTERYTLEDEMKFSIDSLCVKQSNDILSKCNSIGDSNSFNKIQRKFIDGSALKDVKIIDHPENPDMMKQTEIIGVPTEAQLVADVKYEDMELKLPGSLERAKNNQLGKYDNERKFASPVHKSFIDKAKTAVNKLHEMIKNGDPLTGDSRKEAEKCIKDIAVEKFVGIMEKNGAKLPLGSQKEIEKAVTKLPAFKKATEYIGTGTIGEFAFENKAAGLVKESLADIAKNLQDIQKENAVKQRQSEKQAGKQDNAPKNPEHDVPKIEVPH